MIKEVWVWFTEKFGSTVIHPQSLLIRLQKEGINEAKQFIKGDLIDIGCGRMPYRNELEQLVKTYTGVDHPEVSKYYNGVTPEVLADAKKLPFKKNKFDTALLLQVLEHVDSPYQVIKEAARVLKPRGVLILTVPFFYPLHDMPYDFGRYTESALSKFFKDASLDIIKLEKQGTFFGFWLQILNTFLIKRINDIIKLDLNIFSVIELILIVITAIPCILVNNILIVLISYISNFLPRYPNYFPIYYFIIARKNI